MIPHRLPLIKKFFPGYLDRVIQRLQAADIANQDLEEQMFAEDEYLKALIRRDNKISWMELKLEENKQVLEEKDQTLEENKQALEEKDQALEENKQALEENKQALEEKDQAIEKAFKALLQSGMSENDAKQILE